MSDVIMPQLGESIAEGTIVKWLKKVGDSVRRDEDLLVVSTDKVEAELPSPAAGVLSEIRVPEGKTVPIRTVIAIIAEPGSAGAAVSVPKTSPAVPASSPVPSTSSIPGSAALPSATPGRVWFSPLVRKIAREEGISEPELLSIAGTGRNARVNKHDVLAYLDTRAQAPESAAPIAAGSLAAITVPPADVLVMEPVQQSGRATREEAVPLTSMRRFRHWGGRRWTR